MVLTALLVMGSGCVSGHLLDAGRRREVPVALGAARIDGDDVLFTVRTRTVNDLGRPAGSGATSARVPLADLAAARPIDEVRVRFLRALPSDAEPPLPIVRGDDPRASAVRVEGDPVAIVLRHDGAELPPFPLVALTRQRYSPWIWSVMPAAVAVDAVIVPPLLLLAPAIIVMGD